MINRTCDICKEYVLDVWVFVLSDDREKREWSGHKQCVDQIESKVKLVKDLHKKSVDKVLNEINFINN